MTLKNNATRRRLLPAAAALGLLALSGCVAYPGGYYGYPAYGYAPGAYYAGPPVEIGIGGWWGGHGCCWGDGHWGHWH